MSYALKTLGSSIALMLAAFLLALLAPSSSPDAAAASKAIRTPLVFRVVNEGTFSAPAYRLLRLDARTLAPQAERFLGPQRRGYLVPSFAARSPGGEEVGLITHEGNLSDPPVLRILDAATMQERRALADRGLWGWLFGGSTWPHENVFLTYGSRAISEIDPSSMTPRGEVAHPKVSRHHVIESAHGYVMAEAPSLGASYTLRVVRSSTMVETIRLPRLAAGVEDSGAVRLPPFAAKALSAAKATLARSRRTSRSSIRAVGVVPGTWDIWNGDSPNHLCRPPGDLWSNNIEHRFVGGYVVTLYARGTRWEFRVTPADPRRGPSSQTVPTVAHRPRVLLCRSEPAATPSAAPAGNLLAAQGPRWHVLALQLVSPADDLIWVVAPSGLVVEVNLWTKRIRYRKFPGRLPPDEGLAMRAHALDQLTVALQGRETVRFLSNKGGSIRRLGPCVFRTSSGFLFRYGIKHSGCAGLTAYDRSGQKRFTLLPQEAIGSLQTAGRYAYVRTMRADGTWSPSISAVDLVGRAVTGTLVAPSGGLQVLP